MAENMIIFFHFEMIWNWLVNYENERYAYSFVLASICADFPMYAFRRFSYMALLSLDRVVCARSSSSCHFIVMTSALEASNCGKKWKNSTFE